MELSIMECVSAGVIVAVLALLRRARFRGAVGVGDVNTRRQLEIDVVKSAAIVFMIVIHVFEELYDGVLIARESTDWVTRVVGFAGGPLSAPVFMIALGIGVAYSRKCSARANAMRGVTLIGAGYLLNFLRGTLPCALASVVYGDGGLPRDAIVWLLCLDILQFAGVAFLFFALMKRLKVPDIGAVAVSVALLLVGSRIAPVYEYGSFMTGVLGYFTYQNIMSAFPASGWLVYPAAGYVFGNVLRRVADKTRFYARLLAASGALFLAVSAICLARGCDLWAVFMDADTYYFQTPIKALWILSIAGMWFGLLHFVSLCVSRSAGARNLVTFMSRHVLRIYFVQWIIIGWTIWFVGASTNVTLLLTAGVLLTVVSVGIVYGFSAITKNRRQRHS